MKPESIINRLKKTCIRLGLTVLIYTLTSFSVYAQSSVYEEDTASIEKLLMVGVEKMQNGEYHVARSYFQECVIQSELHDSVRIEILAYNNIGNLYYYLNEPDSALSNYYIALGKAEGADMLSLQNTINNNIGIIYATTGHIEEAKVVMERALAISVLLNDTFKMALNLTNLGAQNIALNERIAAESNLLKAKKLFEAINDSLSLHSVYISLGELHFLDSNYAQALTNFELALNLVGNDIHAIEKPTLYISIGRAELALKNHDKAIYYFETAYDSALSINQLDQASVALRKLREVYSGLYQYDKALEYAALSDQINDSIIKLEKENWIAESKTKYQFDLKEREYTLLQDDSKKRSLYVRLIVSALIIIILLLVVILRMRMKTSKLKEEKHLAEKMVSKAKLSKAKTRNIELEEKIETINYELVSKTLLIDNKNQILGSIGSLVTEAEMNDEGNNQHVRQLKQHLLRDSNVEQNWEDFKVYFERVHTSFFQKIHEVFPNLTSNDLRLMAFVLLQFNAKEISQILNITPDSVRKRKQRLREKLNLEKGDDLLNFLYSYTL